VVPEADVFSPAQMPFNLPVLNLPVRTAQTANGSPALLIPTYAATHSSRGREAKI
jgi:hypothetical protein